MNIIINPPWMRSWDSYWALHQKRTCRAELNHETAALRRVRVRHHHVNPTTPRTCISHYSLQPAYSRLLHWQHQLSNKSLVWSSTSFRFRTRTLTSTWTRVVSFSLAKMRSRYGSLNSKRFVCPPPSPVDGAHS